MLCNPAQVTACCTFELSRVVHCIVTYDGEVAGALLLNQASTKQSFQRMVRRPDAKSFGKLNGPHPTVEREGEPCFLLCSRIGKRISA
jgi:hypothetical protein